MKNTKSAAASYWLMKSEPEECSIDDFVKKGNQAVRWDGVRNYQARNFMRQMKVDDLVLLYHSSCKNVGIAGIVKVSKNAYPDPTQFDPESTYFDSKSKIEEPRWSAVDVSFVKKFEQVLSLTEIKKTAILANNPLVKKGNRLSIIPFTQQEYVKCIGLAGAI